jgi:hypothetical protein
MLDGNPFEEPSILWNESRPRTVIKDGHIVAAGDTTTFTRPKI